MIVDRSGVANAHAQRGHAAKLRTMIESTPRLTDPQAGTMALPLARDAIECDLELVGLIIFRNDLREDSPATIAKLRVSDCV